MDNIDPNCRRLAAISLPRNVAIGAFLVPIILAGGSTTYWPALIPLVNWFDRFDPWNAQTAMPLPRGIISIIFCGMTVLLFMKQWSYYYGSGEGKCGFFVDTCGCFNDLEWNLDLLLSFWGGLLFFTAVRTPGLWFICLGGYSFLVSLRCKVTASGNTYANSWRVSTELKGPSCWKLFSTFPRKTILDVAMRSGLFSRYSSNFYKYNEWESRLHVMAESLKWKHPTPVQGQLLTVEEIATGWKVRHLWTGSFALLAGVDSRVFLGIYGPGWTSFAASLALIALLKGISLIQ